MFHEASKTLKRTLIHSFLPRDVKTIVLYTNTGQLFSRHFTESTKYDLSYLLIPTS